MPTALGNVGFQGQTGRHLLTLSSSQVDPIRTSRCVGLSAEIQLIKGPQHLLQPAERPYPMLPSWNTDVFQWIARSMKKHEGEQAPPECRRHVLFQVTEALQKTSDSPRSTRRHEGARAEEIVFMPPSHHVAKVNDTSQLPAAIARSQKEIFGNVFSRENHRGSIDRDERQGFGNEVIKLIQKFCR
jgi:hypothetical protein